MPSETQADQAGMNETARLMRLATYASVSSAVSVIVLKLVAWVLTDSISLLSTLIDSILDAVASLVSLLAVRTALTPADREHRFGHGKAEPLAALGQSLLIVGSAIFLTIEAVERLLAPRPLEHVDLGIGVMIFAIVVTFALTRFQLYVVRKTGSIAIQADSLHYVGDGEVAQLDVGLAVLDAGELQHLLDQLQQHLRAVVDGLDLQAPLIAQGAFQHQPRDTHDRVERRAHLVIDIGQELRLRLVGRFGGFHGTGELLLVPQISADVAAQRYHELFAANLDGGDADLHRLRAAVLAPLQAFERAHLTRAGERVHRLEHVDDGLELRARHRDLVEWIGWDCGPR